MSRTLLKPSYLTRKFRGRHYALCKVLSRRGYASKLCLQAILNRHGFINNRLVSAYARNCKLSGRVRRKKKAFTPRRNDAILRLTCRNLVYLSFVYGLRKKRKFKKKLRMRKFFSVKKYSMRIKFGEFLRTRLYRGFRLRKDVKKVQKMRKDIAKAKKQALHQRKENARLMRKAVMETRAARRRKLGPKVKKKAVR